MPIFPVRVSPKQGPLESEKMVDRLTVVYEGRVQGVGFRATVLDLSKHFEVVGFVRNCVDGRVELHAEGESAELVRFRDAIQTRMQRNIVSASEDWTKISSRTYDEFQISATRS